MTDSNGEGGRVAQRRRTRKAIVAAASELLAAGRTPSVAEVADAADVSRRTVYMYFPTMEQLLVDAALAAVTRDTVEATVAALEEDEAEVEERVATLAAVVCRDFGAVEQQGRTLMRLTIDRPTDGGAADQPVRGYRRVEWIERTVAPLRRTLGKKKFERLVSALAIVIGWESMIVSRDIRGLSVDDAAEVSAWAARALVRASLEDAPGDGKRTSTRARPRESTRA